MDTLFRERPPLASGTEPVFAPAPVSWYYLGSRQELDRGPLRYDLPNNISYVGFLTENGVPVVLSGRCSHMGADLAKGCVRGDRLACPLHGWEYDAHGICQRIPVSPDQCPPSFARQTSFPVTERGGHIFFFNHAQPRFSAPFFDGVEPSALLAAPAFDMHDDVPWYFVGANGFDVQHFKNAHDRVLLGEPVVDSPAEYAKRIVLRLGVAGQSVTDRLTRLFAGPELTMTVTVWGGTLIFVTARFRRTTTYGLMTVKPIEPNAVHARVVVWTRRSGGPFGRLILDSLSASLRRWFIRQFLRSDQGRMSGARYNAGRLIEADKPFADYMEWLRRIHH